MYYLILLLISVMPIIIIERYIYKKDKNKEPIKLLIKLSLGGILSLIITLIISIILGIIFPVLNASTIKQNLVEVFIYAFIGVALVEEFSKWIVTYIITYNNKEFDELYDMIIYCVFVSLGFACIENIMYVFSSGISVGIRRALFSVPGHACNGVFMGYYLGLSKIDKHNKKEDLAKKNLLLSILVPTALHGTFDFCLMSRQIILLLTFYIFVFILYKKSIKKVNEISKSENKIESNNVTIENNNIQNDNNEQYINCPNCGKLISGNFCPNCGTKNPLAKN